MSWLVKKQLLFISIVFIFFSCKDNGEVGLNSSSGKPLKTVFKNNFKISHTTLIDTVKTLGTTTRRFLVGYYIDPVFGKVTAEAYIQLGLGTQEENPDSYRSVDSVYILLAFDDDYSSPPDSQFVIHETVGFPQYYGLHIYELETQLDTIFHRYNLNYNLEVGKNSLDDPTINPYPFNLDPSVSGYLKIYLKNSFGQRILNYAHKEGGTTTPEFVSNELNGIAIVPDLHLPSAVIPFNLAASGISIFYTDSAGNTGNDFRLYLSDTAVTTISSDRSGTPLSKLPNISINSMEDSLSSANAPDQNLYIEGGVGIRQRLNFLDLDSFIQNNGDVLINNAMLYLPVEDTVYAPDIIFMYDSAGRSLSDARLDPQTKSYNMNITAYLQDVIFGKLPYGKVYIQPSWRLNNSSVKRVVISSGIQLQVYYTQ